MPQRHEVYGVVIQPCHLLSLIFHWNVYAGHIVIFITNHCHSFYGFYMIFIVMFIIISAIIVNPRLMLYDYDDNTLYVGER